MEQSAKRTNHRIKPRSSWTQEEIQHQKNQDLESCQKFTYKCLFNDINEPLICTVKPIECIDVFGSIYRKCIFEIVSIKSKNGNDEQVGYLPILPCENNDLSIRFKVGDKFDPNENIELINSSIDKLINR